MRRADEVGRALGLQTRQAGARDWKHNGGGNELGRLQRAERSGRFVHLCLREAEKCTGDASCGACGMSRGYQCVCARNISRYSLGAGVRMRPGMRMRPSIFTFLVNGQPLQRMPRRRFVLLK